MGDPTIATPSASLLLVLHRVVLGCWGLLFLAQLLWWGWLADDGSPRALLIFVTAGPLLLPLRGLLYDRPRSYFWFNLLALAYFAGGVAGAWASGGGSVVAWVQVVASVVGFTAAFYRTKASSAAES